MATKKRTSRRSKRTIGDNGLGFGVVVGQKARQRLLAKFYTSLAAAGREADLWSDAHVIPLTGSEYATKGELWEAHRRELEKGKS